MSMHFTFLHCIKLIPLFPGSFWHMRHPLRSLGLVTAELQVSLCLFTPLANPLEEWKLFLILHNGPIKLWLIQGISRTQVKLQIKLVSILIFKTVLSAAIKDWRCRIKWWLNVCFTFSQGNKTFSLNMLMYSSIQIPQILHLTSLIKC